jgi:hypothetical protein
VGKGVVKWFEDGLSPEPIQVYLGYPATQIAERAGLNIVACLPDYRSHGSSFSRSPSTPYSKVLAEMEQYTGVKIEGKWMVRYSPANMLGYEPLDSTSLAKYSLSVFRDGWPKIDVLAELAADCNDGTSFQSARQFAGVLQPTQYGFNWVLRESERLALLLYHSLPSSAKRQSRDDWVSMPFEDLPSGVRRVLIETFEAQGFGTTRRHQAPEDLWGGFTYGGNFVGEPKHSAVELPRSVLQIRVEQREFLAAKGKVVGNRHYSSGMLTPEVAANGYVETRDDSESSLDYGTLAAFTAERLQMRVRLASGELLYFIFTTDSRNSETRYYPIAQLPGEIGDKLRAEVKRLGG